MMRYQRVSPDCLPLSNGRKPNGENGRSITSGLLSASTGFETKGFRFRSPSRNQDHHHHHGGVPSPSHSDNNQTQKQETSPSPSPSRGGSGDVLLQWGQKKRARVSRSEIRALADESSSSGQSRQPMKVPRRMENNKLSSPTMPPPPPPAAQGGNFRKESPVFLPHRNLEKRSGVVNGSPSRNSGGGGGSRVVSRSAAGKRSPPKMTSSRSGARDEKTNGSTAQGDHMNRVDAAAAATQSEQDTNTAAHAHAHTLVEKVNAEVIEWPRIFIALSRKEKEDDFYAMKGTKLPQRPKKRAKNIDKALQYCFPGMWLSDLSKSRYEVREKKSVKKQQKRRGLKGMESMESDSE